MSATTKRFPHEKLIKMTATGSFDLIASKVAMKAAEKEHSLNSEKEVLLDLRGVYCRMSTFDVFELAQYIALPNPALDTGKKIAVLVDKESEFDHERFRLMCAKSKGLDIRAFFEDEEAKAWLDAKFPPPTTAWP